MKILILLSKILPLNSKTVQLKPIAFVPNLLLYYTMQLFDVFTSYASPYNLIMSNSYY